MGQYWLLANLDKREKNGYFGKFGEIYFDGTPELLVGLIVIPVKPTTYMESDDRFGRWAGDRVVCIGDYTELFPPGVLTEAEEADWAAAKLQEPELFYSVAAWIAETFTSIRSPPEFWRNVEVLFPEECDWVLRNTSKRQYVRGSTVDELQFKFAHEWPPLLGAALMSRITFSNDWTMNMCYEDTKTLSAGRWTGDRVDITFAEQLTVDEGEKDWEDISDAVAAELHAIWTSEYGPR